MSHATPGRRPTPPWTPARSAAGLSSPVILTRPAACSPAPIQQHARSPEPHRLPQWPWPDLLPHDIADEGRPPRSDVPTPSKNRCRSSTWPQPSPPAVSSIYVDRDASSSFAVRAVPRWSAAQVRRDHRCPQAVPNLEAKAGHGRGVAAVVPCGRVGRWASCVYRHPLSLAVPPLPTPTVAPPLSLLWELAELDGELARDVVPGELNRSCARQPPPSHLLNVAPCLFSPSGL